MNAIRPPLRPGAPNTGQKTTTPSTPKPAAASTASLSPGSAVKFQTLSQRRAAHAYTAVEKLFEQRNADAVKFEKEIADPAKKLPYRIRTSGLGLTVAFILGSGGKREGKDVLANLANWCMNIGLIQKGEIEHLEAAYRTQDVGALERLTEESLAYLEWFVRFADARKPATQANGSNE